LAFPLLNSIALSFIHYIAIFASRPYISLLAASIGTDNIGIGLIAGSYSGIQVIMALYAGKIIDRIGPRIPAIFGSVILVIGLVGLSIARHWLFILLCSVLIGFSHLFVLVSSQCVVTGWASGSERENNVGLMTFMTSAASFLGPVLGGWLQDWRGISNSFLYMAFIGAAALILSFTIPNINYKEKSHDGVSTWSIIRNPGILRAVLIGGTVLFSMEVLTIYFPLYGKEIGLSTAAIGTIFSVRGLSSMVVRPFMARILQLFGRKLVLFWSLVIGGFSISLYGLTANYYTLMVISVISGFALGLALPLTLVMVAEIASEEQRGRAMALRIMGNFAGQTVSPILFGVLAASLGLAPIFWVSGGLLMLCFKLIKDTG